ncbi:MAG: metalloregulator ArsR/SmtB family transcription factor [Bdellovibrionota bacterium]
MSRRRDSAALTLERNAETFAALGDPIRLSLVTKLIGSEPRSISDLTEGTRVTRQAITKHLRVLENVGVVHSVKHGRESLFKLDPKPLASMQEYLAVIASQWDDTLKRLKTFVEET